MAKVDRDFLSGFGLETQMIHTSWGSLPLPFIIPPWIYPALSFGALLIELILPVFLFWARTATWAVLVAIVFHAIMLALLHPIWMSFAMPVGLIAFLDDRVFEKWAGVRES